MTRLVGQIALLAVMASGFLALAEDVERPPILIDPPPGRARDKPPPDPPAEPDSVSRDQVRYPSSLPGPRRLILNPPAGEFVQEQPMREPDEQERVKERIDGYFLDLIAAQRAKRGNVDPGWTYLAKRVEHYWQPDFSQVRDERVTEVSGAWLGKTVWDWLGGWYQNASRTGSDGFSPVDEDPFLRVDTTMMDMQLAAYQDSGYGSSVTAIVEIRVDSKGALQARLFETSGHPLFDQAVMDGVEQALENPQEEDLPPGPSRSLYAMSARYVILPPLPVVGFSFDLMLDHFDLLYPLKKMVRGNARLLAVYREIPSGEQRSDHPSPTDQETASD